MKLLPILRSYSKSWWYHAQLRKHGDIKEAAKLERKGIRSNVDTLRKATYFSVGRGGATIWMNDNSFLSTYGDCPLIECCKLLGIKGYDTREIDDFDTIWKFTCNIPLAEKLELAKNNGGLAFNY